MNLLVFAVGTLMAMVGKPWILSPLLWMMLHTLLSQQLGCGIGIHQLKFKGAQLLELGFIRNENCLVV